MRNGAWITDVVEVFAYAVAMKLFVKLVILVVIVAVVGPFFIKGQDGRALWSVTDSWDAFNRWRNGVTSATVGKVIPDAGVVTVYRWQDDAGQWHFTNELPPGQDVDVLLIDPATNMVRAQAPALSEEIASDDESETPSAHISPVLPLPDPETTRRLIEDVHVIQEMADQRNAELEDL
ncbi:MAG: DUF4124 domain-containing protein [Pseudomonadota bacterium]